MVRDVIHKVVPTIIVDEEEGEFGIDFNRMIVQQLDHHGQDWDLSKAASSYIQLEAAVCDLCEEKYFGVGTRDRLLEVIARRFRIS